MMTAEQAEYFRLMLLEGFSGEYRAALEQAQLEEDPLSELTLALSYYMGPEGLADTLFLLQTHAGTGNVDHDAVLRKVWEFYRQLFLGGHLPARDILQGMTRMAENAGQRESSWYREPGVLLEAGDLARNGTIFWEDYRAAAEHYLLTGALSRPWAGKKGPSLLRRLGRKPKGKANFYHSS